MTATLSERSATSWPAGARGCSMHAAPSRRRPIHDLVIWIKENLVQYRKKD
jgi:hypothetical protein